MTTTFWDGRAGSGCGHEPQGGKGAIIPEAAISVQSPGAGRRRRGGQPRCFAALKRHHFGQVTPRFPLMRWLPAGGSTATGEAAPCWLPPSFPEADAGPRVMPARAERSRPTRSASLSSSGRNSASRLAPPWMPHWARAAVLCRRRETRRARRAEIGQLSGHPLPGALWATVRGP